MTSRDEQRFVVAFIDFLRQKLRANSPNGPDPEGLEVAIQCLEASFGISATDETLRSPTSLFALFTANTPAQASSSQREPTNEEKAKADKLKNEGNDLMKDGKFIEAIDKYSEAIRLHGSPIFYCNRAAAYSKMERHQDSINDCQTALKLDPTYSKAYGRMGLAYSCLNKYRDARDAYRKALELDPTNEGFKNNLAIAEEKIRTGSPPGGAGHEMPGGASPFGFDLGSILNNPSLMNFASQMMSDPAMQNMMTSMMSGAVNQGGPQNLGNLLEAGQRLASQMQQQNPELIEQLRRQFQGQGGGPGGQDPNDPQNPQSRPPDQPPPPPPM